MKIPENVKTVDVVKRAMFLAYEACGGPLGMGVFQARNGVTEDDVWKNVTTNGDYAGNFAPKVCEEHGAAKGDYVFGRMMKLSCNWEGSDLTYSKNNPTLDYQGWCHKYKTYDKLFSTALEQVTSEVSV